MRRLVLLPALLAFLVGAVPALAWTWPVDGPVLQPFTLEGSPYAAGQHRGLDVAADEGAPVRAPSGGTVTFAGTVPSGGRSVTIETADGLAVTLLHLGAVLVSEGDPVVDGAPIGVAGWSGDAEQPVPSVHLGIRVAVDASAYLDPLLFLPPRTNEDGGGQDLAPSTVAPAAQDGEEASTTSTGAPAQPLPSGQDGPPPDEGTEVDRVEAVVPVDAEVAPLEPLTVVSGTIVAPSESSPAHAVPSEAAGRAPDAPPSAAEAVHAAPSRSRPSRPGGSAPPVEAEAPDTQSEVGDDRRPRERRFGSLASKGTTAITTTTAIAWRRVRAGDPWPPGVARLPGAVDGDARRPVRDEEETVQAAAGVGTSGGGEWVWRAPFAAILAACVLAIVARRRRGRGGPACAATDRSPGASPAVTTQAVEATDAPLAARPAIRRDPRDAPSRPGRHLDRGGPGTPVRRLPPSVREGRASV